MVEVNFVDEFDVLLDFELLLLVQTLVLLDEMLVVIDEEEELLLVVVIVVVVMLALVVLVELEDVLVLPCAAQSMTAAYCALPSKVTDLQN